MVFVFFSSASVPMSQISESCSNMVIAISSLYYPTNTSCTKQPPLDFTGPCLALNTLKLATIPSSVYVSFYFEGIRLIQSHDFIFALHSGMVKVYIFCNWSVCSWDSLFVAFHYFLNLRTNGFVLKNDGEIDGL